MVYHNEGKKNRQFSMKLIYKFAKIDAEVHLKICYYEVRFMKQNIF